MAEALRGDAIQGVTYVGLTYDDPSAVDWDFGDWHWSEVGVELAMESGRICHAIWDSTITHFELTFSEADADRWLPPQATLPRGVHRMYRRTNDGRRSLANRSPATG